MDFRKKFHVILLLFTALFLMQCVGAQIPKNKMNYVGVWETKRNSPTYMYLSISSNSQISYERKDPGRSVTLSGVIKEWKGKNFVVSFMVVETEFVVQKTPYKGGDGKMHMKVDGVDLIKIGG